MSAAAFTTNSGGHTSASEPGADSPPPVSPGLRMALALADAMSLEALAEVERQLLLRLRTSPSKAKQRYAELGELARMLEGECAIEHAPTNIAPVQVPERIYERLRTLDAPSSKRLIERYTTWPRACRAAWGLLPDGRTRGPGLPWPSAIRGRHMPADYTREECVAAYRACALNLGRRPSSNVYLAWVEARRDRARIRNLQAAKRRPAPAKPLRLPADGTISRLFGGFEGLMSATVLTDEELDTAWRWRLCILEEDAPQPRTGPDTPHDRLAELTTAELAALGIGDNDGSKLLTDGFVGMDLAAAVPLAARLDGSLDWLAGRNRAPDPPVDPTATFDAAAFRQVRKSRKVPEDAIREALDWTLSEFRRKLTGKLALTLGEAGVLAGLLSVPIDEFLTAPTTSEGAR